jgi:hypothetical protein
MPEPATNFFPFTLGLELAAGLTCAILIGRWGWREAKQYLRARAAIQKILARSCVDAISRVFTTSDRYRSRPR